MPTILWRGQTTLVEQPDSPRWEFSERVLCVRVLKGTYALCLASAPMRGALGTGDMSGLRVDKSTVARETGGIGTLTITLESNGQPAQGAQLPPDVERCETIEAELELKKHPLFQEIPLGILHAIDIVIERVAEDDEYQRASDSIFAYGGLAEDLLNKLRRGLTTYPEPGVRYSRRTYYWESPEYLNFGNDRETPVAITIGLPIDLQWLRRPDTVEFDGTHYVVESSWVGSKELDSDLWPYS